MRFADLTPGQAYYYARSSNWSRYGGGARAVLVDGQRYRNKRRFEWRSGEPTYIADPKGTLVLVELPPARYDRSKQPQPRRLAVPPAHLRGPYEQTKTDLEKAAAEQQHRAERQAEQRFQAEKATDETATRAADLGVYAYRDFGHVGRVVVATEQFAAMVEALAAAGWRYTTSRGDGGGGSRGEGGDG